VAQRVRLSILFSGPSPLESEHETQRGQGTRMMIFSISWWPVRHAARSSLINESTLARRSAGRIPALGQDPDHRLEDHVLPDVCLADGDEPLPVNTERRLTDGNHPPPRGSGAGDLPAEIYPPSLPDSFLFPAQRLIGYLQ
jgi:hypothetical protein